MYGLYKDPDGEQVFSDRSDLTTQHRMSTIRGNSDVENMKKRIVELEAQVAKQQVRGLCTQHHRTYLQFALKSWSHVVFTHCLEVISPGI